MWKVQNSLQEKQLRVENNLEHDIGLDESYSCLFSPLTSFGMSQTRGDLGNRELRVFLLPSLTSKTSVNSCSMWKWPVYNFLFNSFPKDFPKRASQGVIQKAAISKISPKRSKKGVQGLKIDLLVLLEVPCSSDPDNISSIIFFLQKKVKFSPGFKPRFFFATLLNLGKI